MENTRNRMRDQRTVFRLVEMDDAGRLVLECVGVLPTRQLLGRFVHVNNSTLGVCCNHRVT